MVGRRYIGGVSALILGPIFYGFLYILISLSWVFAIFAVAAGLTVVIALVFEFGLWVSKSIRAKRRRERRAKIRGRGTGGEPVVASEAEVVNPQTNFRSLSAAAGAKGREGLGTLLAQQPSFHPRRPSMPFDKRFALIDRDGELRFPQIINGTFQIGKEREAMPADLLSFARGVLVEKRGGRFTRPDGSKHGILGFGGKAREAVGYVLDPAIAARLNVPASGEL